VKYTTKFLETELADFNTITSQSSRDTIPRIQKSNVAYPNGVHKTFKEPIQINHRDGDNVERQVDAVRRPQTDQLEIFKVCLPKG